MTSPIEEMNFRGTLDAILASTGLQTKYRVDCPDIWHGVSDCVDYLPVAYSEANIEYQIAYWRGNGTAMSDVSLVLYHDSRPFGIWPLTLTAGNEMRLGSNGGALLPPIFDRRLARKSVKSLSMACLDFADEFCNASNAPGWESRETYTGKPGLSEWHERAMQRGAAVALEHDIFVDLSLDLAAIKTNMRKSYKALITSGRKLGQVGVLDHEQEDIWREFRMLHLAAAGRVTRSDESWELQNRALCNGNAFLVYLRDQSSRMIGGAFFNVTRNEGYYTAGAYDREMFDKPIGHVIQFQAIEEMKRRGQRWYYIGVRPYASDRPPPTEKRTAIAQFQEGFATHLFPRFILSRKINPGQPCNS